MAASSIPHPELDGWKSLYVVKKDTTTSKSYYWLTTLDNFEDSRDKWDNAETIEKLVYGFYETEGEHSECESDCEDEHKKTYVLAYFVLRANRSLRRLDQVGFPKEDSVYLYNSGRKTTSIFKWFKSSFAEEATFIDHEEEIKAAPAYARGLQIARIRYHLASLPDEEIKRICELIDSLGLDARKKQVTVDLGSFLKDKGYNLTTETGEQVDPEVLKTVVKSGAK